MCHHIFVSNFVVLSLSQYGYPLFEPVMQWLSPYLKHDVFVSHNPLIDEALQ